MSAPIIYVDQSKIRDGKFKELRTAMNDLIAFIEANEPQLIGYNVYFSDDRQRMTVIHVHADAASLDFHMKVAGQKFPRFAEFIRLAAIDIYGVPSNDLLEQLRRKAQILGSGAVRVHMHHDGFARFRIG